MKKFISDIVHDIAIAVVDNKLFDAINIEFNVRKSDLNLNTWTISSDNIANYFWLILLNNPRKL